MKTDEKEATEEESSKKEIPAEELEKRKRIVVAVTVAFVILFFILLAVVIAQIVNIAVLKRRKKELYAEYQYLCEQKAQLDDAQDTLDKAEIDERWSKFLIAYIAMYGSEDPFGVFDDDEEDTTSQAYFYGEQGGYCFVSPNLGM